MKADELRLLLDRQRVPTPYKRIRNLRKKEKRALSKRASEKLFNKKNGDIFVDNLNPKNQGDHPENKNVGDFPETKFLQKAFIAKYQTIGFQKIQDVVGFCHRNFNHASESQMVAMVKNNLIKSLPPELTEKI